MTCGSAETSRAVASRTGARVADMVLPSVSLSPAGPLSHIASCEPVANLLAIHLGVLIIYLG